MGSWLTNVSVNEVLIKGTSLMHPPPKIENCKHFCQCLAREKLTDIWIRSNATQPLNSQFQIDSNRPTYWSSIFLCDVYGERLKDGYPDRKKALTFLYTDFIACIASCAVAVMENVFRFAIWAQGKTALTSLATFASCLFIHCERFCNYSIVWTAQFLTALFLGQRSIESINNCFKSKSMKTNLLIIKKRHLVVLCFTS